MASLYRWILFLCYLGFMFAELHQDPFSTDWCEKMHECDQICVDSYTGYYCMCETGYHIERTPHRECKDCHRQLDVGIVLHGDFNSLPGFSESSHFGQALLSMFNQVTIAKPNVQVAIADDIKITRGITPDYRLFIKNATVLRQELYHSLKHATKSPLHSLSTKLDYLKDTFVSQDTGNRYFAPNLAIVIMMWPLTGEGLSDRGVEQLSWSDVIDSGSLLEASSVHITVLCISSSSSDDLVMDQLQGLASDPKSVTLMVLKVLERPKEAYANIWRLMDDSMAWYCYESRIKCFQTEDVGLMCACVITSKGIYPLNGTRCVEDESVSRLPGALPGHSYTSRGLAESLLHIGWVLTVTNCVLVLLLWTYIQIHRSVCSRGR